MLIAVAFVLMSFLFIYLLVQRYVYEGRKARKETSESFKGMKEDFSIFDKEPVSQKVY